LKHNPLLKDPEKRKLLRESIHVHDADVLSNEEAELCVEHKEIDVIDNPNFAVITLDALDEAYMDGQKVTIENLKKRGLVTEEYNGFIVEAGMRLSKPLSIYANDFSYSAVKMIVLTGGRAIHLT